MPHAFADIAFTPPVRTAQQRDGSRTGRVRKVDVGHGIARHWLGDRARPQRAMVIGVEGVDGNCLQHLPARIAGLEARPAQRAAGSPIAA